MVKRKNRLLPLSRLDRKSTTETFKVTNRRLEKRPAKDRRTLTLDNSIQNAQHDKVSVKLGLQCYFTRPYVAWQLGANEPANGLIR
ncbi:MAG TPA: hypothetical protein VEI57_17360 [Nitrospirota bacterium]|nr:hypothetical protein [Nitrospirota bacterium]